MYNTKIHGPHIPAYFWNRGLRLRDVAIVCVILGGLAMYVFLGAAQPPHPPYGNAIIAAKSLSWGTLQYAAQFDDRVPLAFHSGSGSVAPPSPDSNAVYAAINAYSPIPKTPGMSILSTFDGATDSGGILVPESSVPPEHRAQQARFNQALQYPAGFNTQFIHPQGWNGREVVHLPITISEVPNPEKGLLALSSIWARDLWGRRWGFGRAEVDAPCIYDSKFRDLRHGMGEFSNYIWQGGWRPSQPKSAVVFGGAWPIKTRFAVRDNKPPLAALGYLDGSVKPTPFRRLTDGCNVADGHGGTVYDTEKYIWDLSE